MAIYVAQRKEGFIGELDILPNQQCGVSILTNQKVVCDEVFNYFGMHSLFDMH